MFDLRIFVYVHTSGWFQILCIYVYVQIEMYLICAFWYEYCKDMCTVQWLASVLLFAHILCMYHFGRPK